MKRKVNRGKVILIGIMVFLVICLYLLDLLIHKTEFPLKENERTELFYSIEQTKPNSTKFKLKLCNLPSGDLFVTKVTHGWRGGKSIKSEFLETWHAFRVAQVIYLNWLDLKKVPVSDEMELDVAFLRENNYPLFLYYVHPENKEWWKIRMPHNLSTLQKGALPVTVYGEEVKEG